MLSKWLTFGLVVEEVVNLGHGSVVSADGETLVVHVKNQVLAHDGETNEANVGTAEGGSELGQHGS